jgi:aspartate 1-decarboxylase
MYLTLLKAKLHHARVTQSELEYEGSCAIDAHLLEAARIREFEQIHIYNLANGERFITYAIRAPEGSGAVCVNGAAARKASPGDRIIVCSYVMLDAQEAAGFQPTLIYLDERNRVIRQRPAISREAARPTRG